MIDRINTIEVEERIILTGWREYSSPLVLEIKLVKKMLSVQRIELGLIIILVQGGGGGIP